MQYMYMYMYMYIDAQLSANEFADNPPVCNLSMYFRCAIPTISEYDVTSK